MCALAQKKTVNVYFSLAAAILAHAPMDALAVGPVTLRKIMSIARQKAAVAAHRPPKVQLAGEFAPA